MSSDRPVLRLARPLQAVRIVGARADGGAGPRPADPSEPDELTAVRERLAARSRELDRLEQRLARREAELAAREKDLTDSMAHLAGLIRSVEDEKAEMLDANEEDIISLSLSITEKVLQYEIENGRYKIGEVVRSALRAVRDRGSIVIRVNPQDIDLTRAAIEQLGQTYGTRRISSMPDESIAPACCCIETDSGKIFSEIPGRLQRIERTLLKNNGDSGEL